MNNLLTSGMFYQETPSDTSGNFCDKCGRPLDGKGYLIIDGWKICGVCQFELRHEVPKFK